MRLLLLEHYRKSGKQKPQALVWYRDGVSEGQFPECSRVEVGALLPKPLNCLHGCTASLGQAFKQASPGQQRPCMLSLSDKHATGLQASQAAGMLQAVCTGRHPCIAWGSAGKHSLPATAWAQMWGAAPGAAVKLDACWSRRSWTEPWTGP